MTRKHLDIKSGADQDALMRTTLSLDPDVAGRLRKETRRTGKKLKAIVNEALRKGLGLAAAHGRRTRFAVRPHAFGFKPGVDLDRLNQLVDEMDSAEVTKKRRGR